MKREIAGFLIMLTLILAAGAAGPARLASAGETGDVARCLRTTHPDLTPTEHADTCTQSKHPASGISPSPTYGPPRGPVSAPSRSGATVASSAVPSPAPIEIHECRHAAERECAATAESILYQIQKSRRENGGR